MNPRTKKIAAVVVIVLVLLFLALLVMRMGGGGSAPAPLGPVGASPAAPGTPGLTPAEGDEPDDVIVVPVPPRDDRLVGEAFVSSVRGILEEELSSALGWRPNDLPLVGPGWWTDNVNNRQLGKLEVVRHSCRILKTRLARFDDSDAFRPELERAESAFFNDATRWALPSAEKKLREGCGGLREYEESIADGRALFHTRSTSLYDLLGYYKDVLGSCHSILIRQQEADGADVSTFRTDDYFYYSRGVVEALHVMVSAIATDFHEELEARSLLDLTGQALGSLQRGAELEPCLVTNGDLDGLLANHRLNLAGFVADARQKLHSVRETLKK
jgi:hypothetical protein